MITQIRTNSDNADFRLLVKQLDAELAIRDGDDHVFYAQINKVAVLNHTIVAYENDEAIGCGAFKEFAPGIVEVKRMYVSPHDRGRGIASAILTELEVWAKELHKTKCILETGKNQPEALALYQKKGYSVISNYDQYEGVSNSVCFEKIL